MHGREDEGESNIIPFGLRSIVAFFLNLFHSWYIPSQTKIKRDNYLANTYAKAKMWTLMVNHANYADLVLTPSEHFRKKLIHYGVKKDIKVFSSGFPDEKFPKNPPIKSLNPNEELKIIWHSRVSAEKRMMPFLHAIREVQGKYRLDVYGGGGDFFRARRYAKRHKLNVFFHGNTTLDKLYESIKKSHLDVLVSYNFDTFGMTLIEAESAGVPVLFCDPDMAEVVPKGSFIKSRNETPKAIADAINSLLKHPEKIEQMSQIMLKKHNGILMSNRIKDLEKIFNDIIRK
ncbi:glycosyltransferase family 4 protein [Candidatus Saccharibacteria bacterium]|nr:glycosyltransferase family 4 protein [Candidatus Saccharibacteria bacterium]